jgi:ABC-type tungstate transport system permease subunit
MPSQVNVYQVSTDEADDPLLNSAHILIGKSAPNRGIRLTFANWVVGTERQNVVANFTKNGQQLYILLPD